MSQWGSAKARRVLAALLRIGWNARSYWEENRFDTKRLVTPREGIVFDGFLPSSMQFANDKTDLKANIDYRLTERKKNETHVSQWNPLRGDDGGRCHIWTRNPGE